ncbi:extracellular catalytic domain type 2 short-chain-length polyhydroxyalkanoate depolymerase [Thiofilum flexile]|uniref:extracellular catalytic domain type 2 short-chain-length polyhydroxyalkanoate depolymerase n=1 Tax=Thiofilum flexile TaxID=125627 RepID=UPI00037E797D|nr:hypothetical protein [Thiofilum flexile]
MGFYPKPWLQRFAPMVLSTVFVPQFSVAQPTPTLATLAKGLKIDSQTITVSGLSSGAFMALQLHVVFSKVIKGVGLVAGGPYRCAEGVYQGSLLDSSGLYTPTAVCSNTHPIYPYAGPPKLEFSLQETEAMASKGLIDAPEHLAQSKVWLFSGIKDQTVPASVMDVTAQYYQHFVHARQMEHLRHPQAGHAMITEAVGNACDISKSPYISQCGFDAAGDLLTFLLGGLKPKVTAQPESLYTFSQLDYFNNRDPSTSLHPQGHIYIPQACLEGERCRLHIALHGCQQSEDFGESAFFEQAGYNEWAEANHIVVLYPQVRAWSSALWMGATSNPKGCWDWWGYSGSDYATKRGKQVRAIASMVNSMMRNKLLQ